jgi:hypothetical protein
MSTRQLHSKEYAGKRHLMNPQWGYVTAIHTDLRATFERIRAEQQQPKRVRRVK